jgi:hypothetical protein
VGVLAGLALLLVVYGREEPTSATGIAVTVVVILAFL